MCSGIYKILNIDNGKVYIGSAINLSQRKSRHFNKLNSGNHENKYLQNAYVKNKSHFIFNIILFCDIEMLLFYEQRAIDIYQSSKRSKGYNICPTAGNSLGLTHTKMAKIKMSKSRKGKKLSEDHKIKISMALKGKPKEYLIGTKRSVETKRKMSESATGIKSSQAKLCEDDVRSIRRKRKEGITLEKIAEEYGVSIGCISEITKYRNWKHVI